MSTASSSNIHLLPEGVLSPTGTGKTPVPVVAHWFTHSDFEGSADDQQQVIHRQSPQLTRLKRGEQKSNTNLSDDFDNRSIKSDATVVENKTDLVEEVRPLDLLEDRPEQEGPCVITTAPQTPSEIRKKFQHSASFEKHFQRQSEVELCEEFRQGVKGRVKETKECFMRPTTASSDKLEQAKENRDAELEALKHHRSDARHGEDASVDKSQILRQEKIQELENIKRSRSKSRQRGGIDTVATEESGYSKEKAERAHELASLSHRKLDLDDTLLFSPTELKQMALREERERELAALCARQTSGSMDDSLSSSVHKENLLKAERCLELAALSDRTFTDMTDFPPSEHPLSHESQEPLPDPGADHQRGKVRETKALWQQREQSGSRQGSTISGGGGCTGGTPPTRRIGSMFRREQEYWGDDDDLPAPPLPHEALPLPDNDDTLDIVGFSQAEQVNPVSHTASAATASASNASATAATTDDIANPPPPPRQSSRGKVEEYRHWSGGWTRGWSGSNMEAHQKLH